MRAENEKMDYCRGHYDYSGYVGRLCDEAGRRKEDEKNNKIPNMNNMMSQYKSSMPKISIPKL